MCDSCKLSYMKKTAVSLFPSLVITLVLTFCATTHGADRKVEIPQELSLEKIGDEIQAAQKLDAFLRGISPNTTGTTEILFPKGTFCTEGMGSVYHRSHQMSKGFRMQSGWRLKGAGMDPETGTILKLATLNIGQKMMIVCSSPHIDERRPDIDVTSVLLQDTSIEDLVIDCNYEGISKRFPESKDCVLSAIRMYGQNLRVNRVLVLNAASRLSSDQESFIVNLKGVWRDNRPGYCYIGNTVVTNFAGGYTSALHIAGIRSNEEQGDATGVIENCKVYLPGEAQNFGLNCGGQTINVTFRNNEVHGAGRGINNDTGPNFNFRILNNKFLESRVGMNLKATDHGVCKGNEIHLEKNLDKAAYGIAVVPFIPGLSVGASNWIIEDNTIHGNYKRTGEPDIGISTATLPSVVQGKRNLEWFWAINCSVSNNRLIGHGRGPYRYLANKVNNGTRGANLRGENLNQDGTEFRPWID